MSVEPAPQVPPSIGWRFPTRQELLLTNGIRVLAYHCPGQYVVSASLIFDVPLNAEPREVEGVAGLVARCLTRGAGVLTADAFSDALATSGAELEASVSSDGFAVELSVPAAHLARGFELMALAVTSPTYADKEFGQERRLRLQEIEQAKAYPGAVTVDRINAALFGDTRAGRPVGGTTKTVEAVTRDAMASYAAAHLQPGNAALVVAGDFSKLDAGALAQEAFEGWTNTGSSVVAPEASPVSRQPRVLLVNWPEAPQATVRLAGHGITRGDPRWPALFVANYVVGGSFGSRLNTVLREQKGYTYGVSSTLDSGRRVGLLGVGASVQSEHAADAVSDILTILGAAGGSLTDEEVAVGVRAASDSAALGFERAAAVVRRVEMLLSQGLPLDHVDANLERIRRITTADARAAYTEIVDPGALTVVVAGDASKLKEPLEAVGHARVEVVPRP